MNKDRKILLTLATAAFALAYYIGNRRGSRKSYDSNGMTNYFSDKELTYSATAARYGLDNTPTPEIWNNLYALRDNVLNPVRRYLNKPVYVSIAYRSPAVNQKLIELGYPAAKNSQHMKGQAADLDQKSVEANRELFKAIVALGNFDQLIWENHGDWVHVSYNPAGNRKEMLSYANGRYVNINSNWQTQLV